MQINLNNTTLPGTRKTRIQIKLADVLAVRSDQNALADRLEHRANLRADSADLRNHHNSILEQLREMTQQMQQAREAGEAAAEAWRIKLKSLRIAVRIMNGDNVPQIDHDFLIEHNPGLYKMAMSARQHNDDPTDYDALSADEGEGTAAADVIGADVLADFGVPTTSSPSVSSSSTVRVTSAPRS